MKVLLIVLGSLFALLVVSVIVLVLVVQHYGSSLAKDATDPVAQRRTAAKIATFDMPKGYHIESATDMQFSQIVRISRVAHGTFDIQLQGSMAPSNPDAQTTGMKMGLSLVGRIFNCKLKDGGTDDVKVRGVVVKLAVSECTGPGPHLRVESGTFPGNALTANVIATGVVGDGFDEGALHALLESVR